MKLLLFILFTLACSNTKPKGQERALENWIGHRSDELMEHPYFKNLPLNKKQHDEGRETWIFRDQSRYQSSAYCQSLGGCMGLPYYQCDTAFSVKDHKILSATQNGTCPPAQTIEVLKK